MSPPQHFIDDRFSIFRRRVEDIATENERIVEFRPNAAIQKSQCIEIVVPPAGIHYYDLARSYLKVKVGITKSDGGVLAAADKCGFVNYPLATLFRSMEFMLDNQDFCRDVGINLPYKAVIDTLLFRPVEYLESSAQSSLWYKDTANSMDATVPDASSGANQGLLQRYNFTKEGGVVVLEGEIPMDLAQSLDCYIPNGIELRLRLHPSSDKFTIMHSVESEAYISKIHDVVLCLQAVQPTPKLLVEHDKLLMKQNARFFYERSEVKVFSIGKDLTTWAIEQLFATTIPRQLIIGFVSTSAYLGSYSENPFHFQNFDLKYLSYIAEGVEMKQYRPNYSASQYNSEYNGLYRTNIGRPGSGIIQYRDFPTGYALYRILIAPSLYKSRTGQSRLEVEFGTALTKEVTCIIYGTFASEFEIDRARNVIA